MPVMFQDNSNSNPSTAVTLALGNATKQGPPAVGAVCYIAVISYDCSTLSVISASSPSGAWTTVFSGSFPGTQAIKWALLKQTLTAADIAGSVTASITLGTGGGVTTMNAVLMAFWLGGGGTNVFTDGAPVLDNTQGSGGPYASFSSTSPKIDGGGYHSFGMGLYATNNLGAGFFGTFVAAEPSTLMTGAFAGGTGTGWGVAFWFQLAPDTANKINLAPDAFVFTNTVIPVGNQVPSGKINIAPEVFKLTGQNGNDHGNPNFGIGTIGGGVQVT